MRKAALACLPLALAAGAHANPPDRQAAGPTVQECQLIEQWHIDYEKPDVLVGSLLCAVSDDSGLIYLLDYQLSRVLVTTAEGEFVRALGREGEGPGEFRHPTDLCMLPDGIVCVLQGFPANMVYLRPDDTPAGSMIPMSNDEGVFTGVLVRIRRGGRALVVAGAFMDAKAMPRMTMSFFISSRDGEGKEAHRYRNRDHIFSRDDWDELKEDDAHNCFAVDAEGRVWIAPTWDRYLIEFHDRQGSAVRTIEREYQSLARPDSMLQSWRDRGRQAHAEYVVAEHHRDIQELVLLEDGSLLVLTSRGRYAPPDGIARVYDRYDADGTPRESLHMVFGEEPREGTYCFLASGQVVVLPDDDSADSEASSREEAPAAICYRLEIMNQ
jgi:hypothetical protein